MFNVFNIMIQCIKSAMDGMLLNKIAIIIMSMIVILSMKNDIIYSTIIIIITIIYLTIMS